MTDLRPANGGGDPIASAVAKLARAFPLDGDHFRNLEGRGLLPGGAGGGSEQHETGEAGDNPREAPLAAQATCQAQIHHIGERAACPAPATGPGHVRQWSFDPGEVDTLRVTSACTGRYTVELLATGTRVQFVVLAGQSIMVTGNQSDVKITVDELEPSVAGDGLQLVPRVAGEAER